MNVKSRSIIPLLVVGVLLLIAVGAASASGLVARGILFQETEEVEVFGSVEQLTPDFITVAGRLIRLTPLTEFKQAVVVGDFVKVHAIFNADGSLTAREIELSFDGAVNDNGGDDNGNVNGDDDNGNVNGDDDDNGNINGDDDDNGNVNGDDDNSNINGNDDDDRRGNSNQNGDDDDDRGGNSNHNDDDDHNSNQNDDDDDDDDDDRGGKGNSNDDDDDDD